MCAFPAISTPRLYNFAVQKMFSIQVYDHINLIKSLFGTFAGLRFIQFLLDLRAISVVTQFNGREQRECFIENSMSCKFGRLTNHSRKALIGN